MIRIAWNHGRTSARTKQIIRLLAKGVRIREIARRVSCRHQWVMTVRDRKEHR